MNYFHNHGHGLHRCVYVSRFALVEENLDPVIDDIVAKAAANNRARAITGVLLAAHGCFIQALEGSYATLKPLFDAIAADPRHRDVTLKLVESASSRLFDGWGMKRITTAADATPLDIYAASGRDLLQLLVFVSQTAEVPRREAS